MKKPQPKAEVAIDTIIKSLLRITFFATPDAAQDFAAFGVISRNGNTDNYSLVVDARYDFDEVLAYIEKYNKD